MGCVFQVHAHAGARKGALSILSENPLVIRAGIREEPEGGKANRALLSNLESLLGCNVQILAGRQNRKKTLAADCSLGEAIWRIKSADGFCPHSEIRWDLQIQKIKGEKNGKDIH